MKKQLEKQIKESIQAKQSIDLDQVLSVGTYISEQLKKDKKILLAGNGGSAADAQHIAAEFVGRFVKERPALPAIALTTDTSALTAIGNDYGYNAIFSRQLEGLGRAGDCMILISTSGNSQNLIEAATVAKNKHIYTVALTGKGGGALGTVCDELIEIDATTTARIQESHILVGHLLCDIVETHLYPESQ